MAIISRFANLVAKTKSIYKTSLNNHPIVTQAVQVSLLMGLGDVIAQTTVERTSINEINLKRTAQFAGLGLFLVGPTLRFWYGALDKIIKTEKPLKRTVQKVALDQLCFAPAFIAIFTSTMSAIQGMNVDQTIERLKRDYSDILITNYCLWPTVQLLNFRFVPLNYQVVVVQIVALLWNTYFSWKLAHKEQKPTIEFNKEKH